MKEIEFSGLLSEFARTLLTDFSIQEILDHLVQRIVAALPITAAGVTLISPGTDPHYIAASDESALQFELLQTKYSEGPCLLAYHTGEPVVVSDLSLEDRFPAFAPAALAAGMGAAFTFPLRHGDGRLGALDLYRDTPGELDAADMARAQVLADVTAAYVLNAQARDKALETSDRFRNNSLHDPLTGLPNRLLLQQRIEHAALRAERSHTDAAVLFADLDRFKQINDTYGHAVGDQLLVAVGQRLRDLLRPGDTLARVSGDEFVILCEDLSQPGDVDLLAARIDTAFREPFLLPDRQLMVSASVGLAYAGPGQAITTQLITDADIAMYQAKTRGGAGHQIIDARQALQANARNNLEQDLHNAFSRGQLHLAFQPIVRTHDGQLSGVEALLRWTHPQRGPITPLDMIQIAEDNGLIIDIGSWVLRRSCEVRGRWLAKYPDEPLRMAVNVSVRQLLAAGFAATVATILDSTGMDPAALTLEMTEAIFIQDNERAVSTLAQLKDLGVKLALDDFGTGFSSLSYLRCFPVDILKIDRSFITDITRDVPGAAIVAAVSALAHALGLTVIAEGVETREQAAQITDIGCEYAQGFLYARPLTETEIEKLLASPDGAKLQLPVPV